MKYEVMEEILDAIVDGRKTQRELEFEIYYRECLELELDETKDELTQMKLERNEWKNKFEELQATFNSQLSSYKPTSKKKKIK